MNIFLDLINEGILSILKVSTEYNFRYILKKDNRKQLIKL